MKLVSCSACHTQYDATGITGPRFACACGARVELREVEPIDAEVRRCGSCGGAVARQEDVCSWCGGSFVRDARYLSLVCPECYARNDERGRFCTACGVEFRPQKPPGDRKGFDCPVCAVSMLIRPVGGLLVQECPKCNGLWAPGESLNTLLERALTRHRAEVEKGEDLEKRRPPMQIKVVYRRCPECREPMQRKNFAGRSGVIVDWCGSHGTWLDADELEAVAAYLAEHAERPVPGGWRLPSGEDRVHAIYTAEKLLAVERGKRKNRHLKVIGMDAPDPGRTLVDLLDELLS